jgi:hypothetical protein
MALSRAQERLERSLFEAIRKVLVAEGYLPDITNTARYPEPFNNAAQANWEADLNTVAGDKGFAVEAFNHSQTKGLKKVPRIVIIPRRSMPGDIGYPMDGMIIQNPNDPLTYVRAEFPYESSHFNIDIHLVSASAKQDRILNAVLASAFGMKKYVPYYDDDSDRFLIRQYNYLDLPDPLEGIEEKVYSYEIPDVADIGDNFQALGLISQITLQLTSVELAAYITPQTTGTDDGGLLIDLSGIKFT